ncbi:hypothetical protein ACI2IV_04000 [Psychrobacter faecalis]
MAKRQPLPHFKMRFYSVKLYDWIKEQSQINCRTMTAEINYHIQQAMQNAGTKKADATVESNSSASTKSHAKGI